MSEGGGYTYEATAQKLRIGWSTWLERRGDNDWRGMGPYWSLTLRGALRKARREVRRDEDRLARRDLEHAITDDELRDWLEDAPSD